MTDAKLRQESVDRPDLDAGAATDIAQIRCANVILPVGHKKRHRREAIQNLCSRFRPGKALQQLLQHETGRQQCFAGLDRADQRAQWRRIDRTIPPQGQRPDAGINEQAQSRARSAL